jgi:transposase
MAIRRVGIDLGKNVFDVFGVDEHDKPALSKRLSRARLREFFERLPSVLVGMEACATSHYWARELRMLGHEVRLMSPKFVAPYRKSNKNDVNDAEAICEAVGRPTMRFVPIKTPEQQAVLTVHRARAGLIGQRTALANQLRGLLAEYGLVVRTGIHYLRRAVPDILEDADNGLPSLAREALAEIYGRFLAVFPQVDHYDRRLSEVARGHELVQRVMAIAGIGPLTATALVSTIGDGKAFTNGRQLAAWLGLVPRQHSTGGKPRLGHISKRGDPYLRTLFVHGARAALRHLSSLPAPQREWVTRLAQRRGRNRATVALAAKNARVAWALLARGRPYLLGAGLPA